MQNRDSHSNHFSNAIFIETTVLFVLFDSEWNWYRRKEKLVPFFKINAQTIVKWMFTYPSTQKYNKTENENRFHMPFISSRNKLAKYKWNKYLNASSYLSSAPKCFFLFHFFICWHNSILLLCCETCV